MLFAGAEVVSFLLAEPKRQSLKGKIERLKHESEQLRPKLDRHEQEWQASEIKI